MDVGGALVTVVRGAIVEAELGGTTREPPVPTSIWAGRLGRPVKVTISPTATRDATTTPNGATTAAHRFRRLNLRPLGFVWPPGRRPSRSPSVFCTHRFYKAKGVLGASSGGEAGTAHDRAFLEGQSVH